MSFPAPRQRQVGLGELLRDHPQREHVLPVRTEAETAMLARYRGRMQTSVEQIAEVFGREGGRLVVLGGPWRKAVGGQGRGPVDNGLTVAREFEIGQHDAGQTTSRTAAALHDSAPTSAGKDVVGISAPIIS